MDRTHISKKAILFDIDDTLFASTEFSTLARKNAIRAMIDAGLDSTEKKAETELLKIIKKHGSNYGSHYNLLVKKLGCVDPNHCIAAGIWAYHNTKSSISPYPKTMQTLIKLRELGYVLCVASEGLAIKQWDKLIRLRLDNVFDHVFVTDSKLGTDGEIFYKKIAKTLKLKTKSVLMVGDNPKKDIKPAAKVGLKTARLLNGKHAKEIVKSDFELKRIEQILNFV
jgi:putative hydrolase of the HAD superfamily